jgi:microsomal dipeptidase-like Zn-dependent dipeptidase
MLNDYTHITLVVDRSGSMFQIREDAQGGINSLIEEQKKVPGKATVTLYQFNTGYDRVYGPVDVKDAPAYGLVPTGGTALLDATQNAISETGTFLRELPEALRPSQVKFIVVTDGQENSSVEATAASVKEAIAHQENTYGWEFIYIGSDMTGIHDAYTKYGFANTVQYTNTANSTHAMYAGVAKGITTSRMTGAAVMDNLATSYSDEEEVSK